MLQCFYPDKYIVSTYQINFDRLYEQGYRGIIFDIDNTLVEHGAPADERSIALFRHLKELGFRIMLLSNNKEPRVKMFNDAVQVQYLFKAGKPGKAGYEQAMKKLGCNTGNTLFVGASCLRMSGEPDGAEFIRFSYSRLPGMKRFRLY